MLAPELTRHVLLERAERCLELTWQPDEALFPYSTRLVDGALVHDLSHPHTRRYTINSLLGLRDDEKTQAFVERQLPRVTNAGDLGLAAVLLGDRVELEDVAPATMQERCWLIWGAVATGRLDLAERLYNGLEVDARSGLPLHSQALHRRRIVSFGAVVYFLRALDEYARATGDDAAEALFRSGVERMLALQGPQGEWPWMIDVRRGIQLDVYPVFAVHQDAMAMLFLLPALDRGIDVRDAIRRSVAWVDGANELDEPLWIDEPPLLWRSIRRDESFRPQRRYARSIVRALASCPGSYANARTVINRECRSYHPGWILYVWGERDDAAELLP